MIIKNLDLSDTMPPQCALFSLHFQVYDLITVPRILQNLHVSNHLLCNIYNKKHLCVYQHLLQNEDLYHIVLFVCH